MSNEARHGVIYKLTDGKLNYFGSTRNFEKRKREHKHVKYLNKILKNKNNYISTIIILNTVVNIGGSIIIGGMTAQLFGIIPSFYIFGFESYFHINYELL